MSDLLKIENILGYVANDNPLRASRDGRAFEGMIPAPAWTEEVVVRNGSVNDTVNEMRKIIKHYYFQGAKLAPLLKGKSLYDTCRNIWDFLFYHIRYCEDTPNKEELRTLSRTFAERRHGVDCDDFSIAAGSLLRFLNIPFYIRIARYPGKDYFQHVYIVVPVSSGRYITIDGVLDEYDAEKTPIETKDFLVMSNNNLSGIDISVLGDANDDIHNEIAGLLSGADFKEAADLEGLGTPPDEAQVLGSIRNHLLRTRRIIAQRPDLISDTEHPESFLGMVDYALKYWDTPQRDNALGVLEGEENRLNELEGLGDAPEGHEGVDLFYGLGDNNEYNVLGRAKRQRKFFAKIRQAAKKVGQGIKKVAKVLIRFNPLTATIRAAVLLALKINLFKSASKLKWGYLTEQEAQAHGFDMDEWRKVKTRLAKAENMFVNTLQGKAENFKRAILTGRAGKLSGTDLGLGFVATAATAASTTAAIPFITKIIKLLKDVNWKKLIGKVAQKTMEESSKEADGDTPTEDGGSAMPEGGAASDPEPESSGAPEDNGDSGTSGEENTDPNENTDDNGENPEADKGATDSENSEGGEEVSGFKDTLKTFYDKFGKKIIMTTKTAANKIKPKKTVKHKVIKLPSDNPNNLPAKQETPPPPPATQTPAPEPPQEIKILPAPENKNVFDTAIAWVKENPTTSVLIGAGAVFVLHGLFSHKPQRGLSGAGKGKKKKGKNKKNPPKTISSHKGKGKGRGKGGSKKFKL